MTSKYKTAKKERSNHGGEYFLDVLHMEYTSHISLWLTENTYD